MTERYQTSNMVSIDDRPITVLCSAKILIWFELQGRYSRNAVVHKQIQTLKNKFNGLFLLHVVDNYTNMALKPDKGLTSIFFL